MRFWRQSFLAATMFSILPQAAADNIRQNRGIGGGLRGIGDAALPLRGRVPGHGQNEEQRAARCEGGELRKGKPATRVCRIRGGGDVGANEDTFDALEKMIFSNPALAKFATQMLADPTFNDAAERLFQDPASLSLVQSQAELPLPDRKEGADEKEPRAEGHLWGQPTEGSTVELAQDAAERLSKGLSLSTNQSYAEHGGRIAAAETAGQIDDGSAGAAGIKVEGALLDMMSRTSRMMSMKWTEEKEKEMASDPVLAAMYSSEKLATVREDVEKNGMTAIIKYAKDPEAMKIFERIMALTLK